MRRTAKGWLPILLLASFPAVAYANAGTPLMWAGALHMVFGNAIIGVAEGLLLGLLFRRPLGPAIGLMIVANYFSAWIGSVWMVPTFVQLLDLDLYNAWGWMWGLVAVTYVLTLLLEWPFVAFCFRKTPHWFLRSIAASLVVQTASYLVLFGWYWGASGTSLYTEMTAVPLDEFPLPQGAVAYYIAEQDGDVYAWHLGQPEPERVCALGSHGRYDRLIVRKTTRGDDLVARLDNPEGGETEYKRVLAGLAGSAVVGERDQQGDPPGDWFNDGEVPRLEGNGRNNWKFRTGYGPWSGIYGEDAARGRELRARLETPFAAWAVRNPTQLPNDQVIFQLGADQICILDPNRREIALIAKGRGPVVVLKEQPR